MSALVLLGISSFVLLPSAQIAAASTGYGLAFNGSGQYVTFGPAAALDAATFTVETWFDRTGTGVGTATGDGGLANAIPLVTKGRSENDGSNVDMNYFLGIDATTGKLAADFEEGATGAHPGLNHPVIGTTTITTNAWHHAAATYDGTTWRLYLDGTLDGQLTVGQPPRSDSIQHAALATAMNSQGQPAGYFNGILDEPRIWNIARTQAQIQTGMTQPLTTGTGLIGRWGLDEGSGTTANDSITTSPNGTLIGTPTWTTGAPFTTTTPSPTPTPTTSSSSPTPPPPPPPDPVLVGAGDIANCANSERFATAAVVKATLGDVFTLGDNAYENATASDFTNCYDPSWGAFKARTHPAPGNHDYQTTGAAGYFGYFGAAAGDPAKGYYTYDLGSSWHVVVLNSECAFIGGCEAGSPEETWFRSDLIAHSAQNVIVIWHEPRFSSGYHGDSANVVAFWNDAYTYGADIVMSGHDHDYERFAPMNATGQLDNAHGVREFVVGTGGASLDPVSAPRANSQVLTNTAYGALKLTLHASSYDWQFLAASGSFTDSGTSATHTAP